MTKKKSTKRALISSLLILAMCFTMLAGTTFAWFTDSVESGNNIIKSGKLDVDLFIKQATDTDYVSVTSTPAKAAFDYDLWEPGYTTYAFAKVKNVGNLALKYELRVLPNTTFSALAEVIDVYYADGETAPADRDAVANMTKVGTLAEAINGAIASGNLAAGVEGTPFTIALQMQTTAGNEYQELDLGGFKFVLVATQDTVEPDAFDNQYDKDAEFPVVSRASDNATLNAAFDVAENDGKLNVVEFTQDIVGSGLGLFNNKAGYSQSTNKNVEIDLNGHTWEIGAPAVGSTGTETQALHIEKGNTVVVKNGKIKGSTADGILMLIQNYGNLTLENCEIEFDDDYALSCNCGTVIIKDTKITTAAGKTAFDVCVTDYYPDGTQVYVEGNTIVNGNVEFDVWGTKPAENKSTLTINGGTFNGDFVNTTPAKITDAECKAMTSVSGGTFNGDATLIGK